MISKWRIIGGLVSAVLLVALVLGVAFIVPSWLFIVIFISLLVALTCYTWSKEGARKAIVRFIKELLLGW